MLLQTRKSLIVSIVLVIFGAGMISLFELGAFNAHFISAISPRKSPYEPGS